MLIPRETFLPLDNELTQDDLDKLIPRDAPVRESLSLSIANSSAVSNAALSNDVWRVGRQRNKENRRLEGLFQFHGLLDRILPSSGVTSAHLNYGRVMAMKEGLDHAKSQRATLEQRIRSLFMHFGLHSFSRQPLTESGIPKVSRSTSRFDRKSSELSKNFPQKSHMRSVDLSSGRSFKAHSLSGTASDPKRVSTRVPVPGGQPTIGNTVSLPSERHHDIIDMPQGETLQRGKVLKQSLSNRSDTVGNYNVTAKLSNNSSIAEATTAQGATEGVLSLLMHSASRMVPVCSDNDPHDHRALSQPLPFHNSLQSNVVRSVRRTMPDKLLKVSARNSSQSKVGTASAPLVPSLSSTPIESLRGSLRPRLTDARDCSVSCCRNSSFKSVLSHSSLSLQRKQLEADSTKELTHEYDEYVEEALRVQSLNSHSHTRVERTLHTGMFDVLQSRSTYAIKVPEDQNCRIAGSGADGDHLDIQIGKESGGCIGAQSLHHSLHLKTRECLETSLRDPLLVHSTIEPEESGDSSFSNRKAHSFYRQHGYVRRKAISFSEHGASTHTPQSDSVINLMYTSRKIRYEDIASKQGHLHLQKQHELARNGHNEHTLQVVQIRNPQRKDISAPSLENLPPLIAHSRGATVSHAKTSKNDTNLVTLGHVTPPHPSHFYKYFCLSDLVSVRK